MQSVRRARASLLQVVSVTVRVRSQPKPSLGRPTRRVVRAQMQVAVLSRSSCVGA
jgi:hypothetical protein